MVRFTDDANRFWLEQSLAGCRQPRRAAALARCRTVSISSNDIMISVASGQHPTLSVKRGDDWIEIGKVHEITITP